MRFTLGIPEAFLPNVRAQYWSLACALAIPVAYPIPRAMRMVSSTLVLRI